MCLRTGHVFDIFYTLASQGVNMRDVHGFGYELFPPLAAPGRIRHSRNLAMRVKIYPIAMKHELFDTLYKMVAHNMSRTHEGK